MTSFYLLDAPYSGADVFLHHCEIHSKGEIKRYRDTLTFDADNSTINVSSISPEFCAQIHQTVASRQLGILVKDPAIRLAQAYFVRQKLGKAKVSFAEYFSTPSRLNIYTQMLHGHKLEDFGFVGVFERFNSSLLLAKQWLNNDLRIQQYFDITAELEHVVELLTVEHLAAIRTLHAQDYELYDRALALVNERFDRQRPQQTLRVPKQKEVIIHVGPPKTGTSAIQKWLNENRDSLARSGIYYPPHSTDTNGVSSGNFLSVLSPCKENNYYRLDPDKFQSLLDELKLMPNQTLLLSSEMFHNHLLDFFQFLPNAKYVFYIRHPIDLIESSYHQEVKRHRRTTNFRMPEVLRFNRLCGFINVCAELKIKPTLRFYDVGLLTGVDLITDFVDMLELTEQPTSTSQKVNSRFGFGELELMRECNSFLSDHLLSKLDLWLQQQSQSKPSFTLVSKVQSDQARHYLVKQINALVKISPTLFSTNDLVKKLEKLALLETPRPYFDQSNGKQEAGHVWNILKRKELSLAGDIVKQYRQHMSTQPDTKNSNLFKWTTLDQVRLKFSTFFKRFQR
ncbi:hypothetical protein [Alteromonas flava]|uniref:hypothetical protein n=1 Tax=Alteromonas flava TaxID=2048003 RepID=UPI000C291F5B|nr:hypothetical protein [Alteromonas flava]